MSEAPPSHPPSEPRTEKRRGADLGMGYDRPARLQMLVALVLGLVLVAIPLYLWRRPRAESPIVTPDADTPAPLYTGGAIDADASAADASGPLALDGPKILECHDPGPSRTSPDQCDHLVDFERLFTKAIQDASTCAPTSAGQGAIPWIADVSFVRKRQPIRLLVAKDGHTLKGPKTNAACTAAVKKNLGAVSLDGMKHDHARYKIEIIASYPAR
jgi:hypothetical protein